MDYNDGMEPTVAPDHQTPNTYVVLKSDAEYALDREAFAQMAKRRGTDTLLTWVYQEMFTIRQRPGMDAGTITDPRR
jgi:hypothetical protein